MKGLLIPVIDRKLGYSQYYVELLNFDRRVGKSMEAVMLNSCNFIRIQPYIFWVRLRFPKIISVLPQRWVLWICGTYVCCNCFTMLTSPGLLSMSLVGWLCAGAQPAAAEARGEVLPQALRQHQGLRGLVPVPPRPAQGWSAPAVTVFFTITQCCWAGPILTGSGSGSCGRLRLREFF